MTGPFTVCGWVWMLTAIFPMHDGSYAVGEVPLITQVPDATLLVGEE